MYYDNWFNGMKEKIMEDYFTYLKFPSISAYKENGDNLKRCAHWLEKYLKEIGFQVQKWGDDNFPLIFGEKLYGDDVPTLLFYCHYDVQPAEPFELWYSDPFDPEIRNGRVYARGAEDNKGQSFYTLCAIKSFFEKNIDAKINIKVLIDAEEEMGSETLTKIIPIKEGELRADCLLVVDVGMGSLDNPSISIGARGIMTMEVNCKVMDVDAHSGELGGIAYSPIRAITEVLGKIIDDKGRIVIPEFYRDISPIFDEDKKALDLFFDKKESEKTIGLTAFHSEDGYTTAETNLLRPTFEINGICGGYTGIGFKTIIPKEASAKISCRLVPKQDFQHIYSIVCKYFNDHLPPGVVVEFKFHGGGAASFSSPNFKCVNIIKKVYTDIFGKCRLSLTGGSIPIVCDLSKCCNGEFVMLGTALEMDSIHAPNENFGLDQFKYGFLIIANALELFMKS